MWEILKSPNIVNLHREMTMLKLKINVNLPQLLCIVISAAENGEFLAIEWHEKKRKPFSLSGVRFESRAILISG